MKSIITEEIFLSQNVYQVQFKDSNYVIVIKPSTRLVYIHSAESAWYIISFPTFVFYLIIRKINIISLNQDKYIVCLSCYCIHSPLILLL